MAAASIPVLLVGYNRVDTITEVLEALAIIQPPQLFVSLDGPKASKAGDAEKCAAVEQAVCRGVTWPCELQVLARKENLGCGPGMVAGITWFFAQVEAGIVLEDDIVVGPEFYRFVSTMLERYKDDPRVWAVTGVNFQDGHVRGDASYYFSKYVGSWGWAGWRSRWQHYQHQFPDLDEMEDSSWWKALHPNPIEAHYWKRQFREAHEGRADAWDYQWQLKCWEHGAVIATPNKNLTTNIGCGPEATHTADASHFGAMQVRGELGELTHPSSVEACKEGDEYLLTHHYCPTGSVAERIVIESLIKRQAAQIKKLGKALKTTEGELERQQKQLAWAAGHRWKAARRLISRNWPPKES